MSNRIYLNSGRDETSKFGLNRINWSEVATRMAQVKAAEDRGEQILRFSNDFIDPHLLRVAQDDMLAKDAAQLVQESGSFDQLSPEQASALKSNPHILHELVQSGAVDEAAVHAFAADGDSDDMGGAPDGDGDDMGFGGDSGGSGGLGDPMASPDSEPIFAAATASSILERIAKKKGGKVPAHLAKFLFKKKGDEKSEKPEDEEKEDKPKDEAEEPAKKSFNKMVRKGKDKPADKKAGIESIKADAIHEAEATGDFERAASIQTHRSERRIKLAQALAELEIDKMRREAKQKKQRTAVAQTEAPKVEAPKAKTVEAGFKSPSDMNPSERVAFVRKAEALGFPAEYVENMLGLTKTAATNPIVATINEIGRSELSKEVKVAAVQGLLKTADLEKEDADRIYDYYVNELGYDPEWTKALVTNYKA